MLRAAAIILGLAVTLGAVSGAGAGNGAPSGPHYNLNLIGVPKGKSAVDTSNSNGKRIFVSLEGRTRILLSEGPFDVLDYNGTDGEASFQLPNPDPDGDGTTAYSVYVRALGKPGGKATLQSCFEDSTGTWCAADFVGGVEPIMLERTKGKQTFQNVSRRPVLRRRVRRVRRHDRRLHEDRPDPALQRRHEDATSGSTTTPV